MRGVLFHPSADIPTSYLVKVLTNNAGQPGTQLGSTTLPGTGFKIHSWNWMDLSTLALDLSAGTEYFVTIQPQGTVGSFRRDTGTTTSRSSVSAAGGAFTALTGDALIRPVMTSLAAALPVELALFEAHANGARALLTWTTASETNNAGFAVEMRPARCADPACTDAWTTLGP